MRTLKSLVSMLAIVGLVFLLAADVAAQEPVEEEAIGLEELRADPEPFFDRDVTVDTQVADVIDDRSFTVLDEGLAEDEATLVLGANEEALANLDSELAADQPVRLRGMVRRFNVAELEQDLGIDLPTEVEEQFEQDEPVIVAESVEARQEGEQPSQDQQDSAENEQQGDQPEQLPETGVADLASTYAVLALALMLTGVVLRRRQA